MSVRELALELLEEENAERPDVVRLARALSVAARVEPVLLRRIRTRLFPEMDPGAESDLWFSPLVASAGYGGFVLDPDIADVLRESLAEDHRQHAGPPGSSLLSRMEAVLAEVHGGRLPSIWAEEQATVMALRGDPPGAIEEALRPAAKAMLESDERGLEIARWALRALPRLPEAARRTEAAAMLALGASARLGGRPVAATPDADGGALSPHLAWALPPDTLSERTVLSLRLLRGGIEFLAPDAALPVVSLPRTHPLLVQLSWSTPTESGRKLAQAQPGKVVYLPEAVAQVTLRTLAGDEYDLRAAGPGGGTDEMLDPEYAWAADALVRVQADSIVEVEGLRPAIDSTTGWMPAPGLVVTTAFVLSGATRSLHVAWRDRLLDARIVGRDDGANLLLELTEPLPEPVANLAVGAGEFEGIEPGQILVALGLLDGRPVSTHVRVRRLDGGSAEAEFLDPAGSRGDLFDAMLGGPVLWGSQVVGFVGGPGGMITVEVLEGRSKECALTDTTAIHRLLAAAVASTDTQQQSAPEPAETQQAAAPPTPTDDAGTARPTVFISYSRSDEVWNEHLATHLRPYEDQGLLTVWNEISIPAGVAVVPHLQTAMEAAKVAVVLVSANSLNSEWVRLEVEHLLQRRDRESLHIIPVLIEPCDWESVDWLRGLQIRPRSGVPLSHISGRQAEEELAAIASEAAAILAKFSGNVTGGRFGSSAAGPPNEGNRPPAAQSRRGPEASNPASRVFKDVWYSPKHYGIFSVRDPDIGTLTVHANRVEFEGRRGQVIISSVREVEHVRMGGDIRKNWVRVSYEKDGGPLEAFFADASPRGLGNLRGGSEDIYAALFAFSIGRSTIRPA